MKIPHWHTAAEMHGHLQQLLYDCSLAGPGKFYRFRIATRVRILPPLVPRVRSLGHTSRHPVTKDVIEP